MKDRTLDALAPIPNPAAADAVRVDEFAVLGADGKNGPCPARMPFRLLPLASDENIRVYRRHRHAYENPFTWWRIW